MIQKKNCIVMDLDGTLCPSRKPEEDYSDLSPDLRVLNRLREYRQGGFYVIFYTSRNMQTFEGNIGLINANTAKTTLAWLDKYDVPYDEIHFGKPWPGHNGFYVDDRAVRPDEFIKLSFDEIAKLVKIEKTTSAP